MSFQPTWCGYGFTIQGKPNVIEDLMFHVPFFLSFGNDFSSDSLLFFQESGRALRMYRIWQAMATWVVYLGWARWCATFASSPQPVVAETVAIEGLTKDEFDASLRAQCHRAPTERTGLWPAGSRSTNSESRTSKKAQKYSRTGIMFANFVGQSPPIEGMECFHKKLSNIGNAFECAVQNKWIWRILHPMANDEIM